MGAIKNSKKIAVILGLFLTIFLIQAISAEIVFSQLNALYNLGDPLANDVKITGVNPGYLDINLICSGQEKNLYHNVPDSSTISIKRFLTPAYIDDLSGDCVLSANYGNDSATSAGFKISNKAQVNLDLQQSRYDAGTNAVIRGKAIKENGIALGSAGMDAFIEISLNGELKATDLVKDGVFNTNFSIDEKTHAGNYTLDIKVYDKDSQGNILNSGSVDSNIQIIQYPSRINLALDSVSVIPGNNLTIIPFLYDKADDEINYSLMLQVTDNNGNIVYQGIVNGNSPFLLNTTTQLAAENLNITCQKDSIISQKTIKVLEFKKLTAEIVNQTIVLTNIGNVPYNQIMQFQVGNETIMKQVTLALNETKSYDVSAPDGVYDVQVKDDSSNILQQSGVSMTGNVISIQEASTRVNNFITEYPVVWIFILLVIAGFLYSWFRRYQNTKFLGNYKETKSLVSFKERGGVKLVLPTKEKLDQTSFRENKSYQKMDTVQVKDIRTNKSVEKINIHGNITKAEQVSILNGPKQQVSVIAIKVKSGKPVGMAKENLSKALEYAYAKKGAAYMSGDYFLVLFSELLTKRKDNETTAVNVARDMEKFLEGHNRKFRDELTYGIGVNCGQLIIKVEDNTLKFVSIEKTIILAKKIADASSGEALLSNDIHLKTASGVKTDKIKIGDVEAFKIKRVVDTQAGEKFIKEFLRRN